MGYQCLDTMRHYERLMNSIIVVKCGHKFAIWEMQLQQMYMGGQLQSIPPKNRQFGDLAPARSPNWRFWCYQNFSTHKNEFVVVFTGFYICNSVSHSISQYLDTGIPWSSISQYLALVLDTSMSSYYFTYPTTKLDSFIIQLPCLGARGRLSRKKPRK